MSTGDYVPFGLTDEEAEVRRVLVGGVPPWMRGSLLDWLRQRLCTSGWVDMSKLHDAEAACLLTFRLRPETTALRDSTLLTVLSGLAETDLLRLADYALSSVTSWETHKAESLGKLLDQSASRWKVGVRDGRPGLVERVPSGVQEAAEATINAGGASGRLLGSAWSKVHRFEPDDSGAYADAVKAVEVASFTALGITKETATLGDTIRAIRSDDRLGLPFSREDEHTPTNLVLKGMLQMIWAGHHDRHGSFEHQPVSHAEADAAVTAAVSLVQWFSSGAVQRREQSPPESVTT